MKKLLFALAVLAVAVSCSVAEKDFSADTLLPTESDFTAYFQTPEESAQTKLYMDSNFHLWWNSIGGAFGTLTFGDTNRRLP